jgi:hypothetical protein
MPSNPQHEASLVLRRCKSRSPKALMDCIALRHTQDFPSVAPSPGGFCTMPKKQVSLAAQHDVFGISLLT